MFFRQQVCWKSIGSFLNAENIAEDQMQKIAAEINFAESTFI
jgi:trans-2,3-dihydro-3-hydroxyanthranilate isomerase